MARILPVVAKDEKAKDAEDPVAEIDLDEFEEDRRDSKWQTFLSASRQRRAQMRLERRIR